MCDKPVEDAKKVLSAAKAMQDEINEIMKPVVSDEGSEASSQEEGRTLRVDGQEVNPRSVKFDEYRKLPVVVQAVKIVFPFEVVTLEGTMKGNAGDYLIQGVHGELYPCKPDIFAETYELVDRELSFAWYKERQRNVPPLEYRRMMEGRFDKIEQPPPISGGSLVGPVAREMFERILQEQEAKGLKKYGTPLSTHNGRNPVLDALAEVVDAFQYLIQGFMEQVDEIDPFARGDDD